MGIGARAPRASKRYLAIAALLAGSIASVGGTAIPSGASGIIDGSGSVVEVTPPPDLRPGQFEDPQRFRLIQESHLRSLTAPLVVDFTAPGLYDTAGAFPLIRPVTAAGTVVDSYLLHADPIGQPQPGTLFSASLTFDTDILAVEVTDAGLDAGDPLVGAVGTLYPTGVASRGFEIPAGPSSVDSVRLGADRRTVDISVITSTVTDEIRIVTAGSTSAPGITPGGGTPAGGSAPGRTLVSGASRKGV